MRVTTSLVMPISHIKRPPPAKNYLFRYRSRAPPRAQPEPETHFVKGGPPANIFSIPCTRVHIGSRPRLVRAIRVSTFFPIQPCNHSTFLPRSCSLVSIRG